MLTGMTIMQKLNTRNIHINMIHTTTPMQMASIIITIMTLSLRVKNFLRLARKFNRSLHGSGIGRDRQYILTTESSVTQAQDVIQNGNDIYTRSIDIKN